MSFQAPVRQIKFALDHIAGFGSLYGHSAFPELSADVADAILEEAGRFANEVLAPLNRSGDQEGARLDGGNVRLAAGFEEAYRVFVASGWSSITGSSQFGGQHLPHTLGLATQEMWHAANMSFTLCPLLSQGAIDAISAHGTEQQKALYLPKLISGEWTGTMNLTEPQAGSDVGALRAKAERAADGTYRISGTKIFITWGEHTAAENIVHLVLARLPESPPGTRGISLFIVPKRLPLPDGTLGPRNDVVCTGLEHKLGIHASPTCVMSYGERGGATGFLLGAENKGMAAMFTMMNSARLGIGMQGVGIAERSFQQALTYARERRQGKPFGLQHEVLDMSPIIFHADVRRMLLTQKAMIEAGRAICLANAMAIDVARHGETADARAKAKSREELLTPLSKGWCTDMAVEATSLGVQVHGGMGFIEETGAAQHFRDARIAPIYEGTNGIQAIDLLSRKLSLQGGDAVAVFLREVQETADACKKRDGALGSIGGQLHTAHEACRVTVQWLQGRLRTSPADALPGASALLRQMGLLAGAHYLGRGAIAAARLLEAGASDRRFLETRIAVAQFFAEQLLPQVSALVGPATAGQSGPFALSGEDIGL